MKKLKDLFKIKSIFTGLFIVYASAIILSACILGYMLSKNVSDIIMKTDISSNHQKLTSLEYAYQNQNDSLKSSMRKIYMLNINQNTPVSNYLQKYLSSTSLYSNENYLNQFRTLYNYMLFEESPSDKNMNMFLITGKTLKPFDILYSAFPSGFDQKDYVKPIMAQIYKNSHSNINESTINILPAMTVKKGSSSDHIYVIYDYLRNIENSSQYFGYVVTAYTAQNLDSKIGNGDSDLWDTYYILTETGDVVYTSTGNGYEQKFQYFDKIAHISNGSVQTTDSIINVKKNDKYGFYVVSLVDKSGLYRDVNQNNKFIIIIVVLCSIVAIVLTNFLTRLILRRIRPITKAMKTAKDGDLSARATVSKSGNEFDMIAESFNSMMCKIDEDIQLRYISEIMQKSAELKQKESELYALQTQINPHFLYNTLEIIRMKALTNKDSETASLIRMLATIFRSRTKDKMVITIREEIRYCNSLMELYSVRYDGELNYDFNIDESIMGYAILKDLLHPILENAVVHGLCFGAKTEDESNLTISAVMDSDNNILFSLSDNGHGIDADTLSKLNESLGNITTSDLNSITENKHIGFLNVQQRIKLAYGNDYGISITSSSSGTTVNLKIKALSVQELTAITRNSF